MKSWTYYYFNMNNSNKHMVHIAGSSSSPSSFFRRYNFILWTFLAYSTYNFHLLRSWMQLVQFFIFSFFVSFLMSSSHMFLVSLVVVLTSVSTCILFFTILSFSIRCKWPNQLNLCAFVWLITFYVILIHLIHRLYWFYLIGC